MNLNDLLKHIVAQHASDLHISADTQPWMRIHGKLQNMECLGINTEQHIAELLELLTTEQKKQLTQGYEIDFSYSLDNIARFRINIFYQQNGLCAAFRVIPHEIKTIETLKLPLLFKTLTHFKKGLVLIVGTTGSGKSTTMAALIHEINSTRAAHIITLEDPVEFIHTNQQSLIHQREVGKDTLTFQQGLRAALREDPDIIFVGELRDLETIQLAITAAETGHLVFATLHTASAAKTIHRIIDVFPGDEKETIRSLLSESLQAVVAQELILNVQGSITATHEIMICTPAIRNLIRENKISQIQSCLQTGGALGMKTFDQDYHALVRAGVVKE